TVSLSEKNVSIINIFKKIKAQTNYNLICKSEIVKKFPPLSIELKGAPLKDALDQLLDPHGFSYVIKDNNIIIKEKPPVLNRPVYVNQQKQITGKVVDENGEAMSGVTVVVKGNSKVGTTTDANG